MTDTPRPQIQPLQTERSLRFGLPFPGWGGWKGELAILSLFALATLILTWPIAISMDQASGLRGDYFNNLWNAWWMRKSLTGGMSPWWTDYMYYPEGISLKRHTLSPINAGLGALFGSFLSPHAAFNAVLMWHLALSGWTFSLLARYVTRSSGGGILGGLLYTFAPFHFYYLCQINVFTWEFAPLAVLFFLRFYSHGRRADLVGVGLTMMAIAMSTSYFVMYVFLMVGLLVPLGRFWDSSIPWKDGVLRTVIAGAVGAVGVVLGALPLLWAMVGPESALEAAIAASDTAQGRRENDLFGYFWLGGPEEVVVSWPTMLGYGTLLLWIVGRRGVASERFWLWVGGIFVVLSLGSDLDVGGEPTGIWMPFAVFKNIPVLSMLRKADRFFFVIQFCAGILTAAAWATLAKRLGSEGKRYCALAVVAAILLFETQAVPLARFDYEAPRWFHTLAEDDSVQAVVELPSMDLDVVNARFLLSQIVHGKKQPLGYTTSMAVSTIQEKRMLEVVNKYAHFLRHAGTPSKKDTPFQRLMSEIGIDRVIQHKSMPRSREPNPKIDGKVLWAPFFVVARQLMDVRQMGRYIDEPLPGEKMVGLRADFSRAFGLPVYEDAEVMVFAVKP
ncbi:MAG: hypothetical protein CMJ89_02480 [Planctomycetes bacterium]|nr:hypothetical protein [Planctomycetota bacterium]